MTSVSEIHQIQSGVFLDELSISFAEQGPCCELDRSYQVITGEMSDPSNNTQGSCIQ